MADGEIQALIEKWVVSFRRRLTGFEGITYNGIRAQLDFQSKVLHPEPAFQVAKESVCLQQTQKQGERSRLKERELYAAGVRLQELAR